MGKGLDYLFHHIADKIVDNYFPLLELVDDQIEALEDEIVVNPSRKVLNTIFSFKQGLVELRKISSPQREVFNALTTRDLPAINAITIPYFRDLYDHMVRIYEIIDSYRDLMSNALDAYLSTVSNNLNEVMKRLTIFATIFMPITFLTGFFGMNFSFLSIDNGYLFAIVTVFTWVIVPTIMLVWFRRSKWL